MAFGAGTISSIGGAVNDLFAADADRSKASGLRLKAQGDALEGENYDLASDLALKNEEFAKTSTEIKQAQLDRSIYQTTGGIKADVAGAGFAESGSSLDILRDSASQGALTKAVAGQQGLIQEAGYDEQAQSYQNLSKAAALAQQGDLDAADAADKAAEGAGWSAAIKGVAAVASIVAAPATGGASLAIGGLFMGGGSPSGY